MMEVDVAIVGAGIAGCMTARELSRYQLRTVVVEKELDVATGQTKASTSGIHPDMGEPGSLRARLTVQGNAAMEQVCEELYVSLMWPGSIIVAFSESDMPALDEIRKNAELNGAIPYEWLTKEELLELEPNVSREVIGGLYHPREGMLYSFDLSIAAFENAVANGVEFFFDTELVGLEEGQNGGFLLHTTRGDIAASHVVNAAGLFVDQVSQMIGDDEIQITPVRGQHLVMDRRVGHLVKHMVGAIPTPHGNLLIGGTFEDATDKERDHYSTAEARESLFQNAQRVIPSLDRRLIIRQFAGLRSWNQYDDHLVQVSKKSGHLINISLISGGVTAGPAVAKRVVELLDGNGLALQLKRDFNPYREPIPDFSEMTDVEKTEMIKRDPRYGRAVCRCETVTEGEIVEAIKRGARTMDGVKFRTRAGMGRCQGGFCGPRVMSILAQELGGGMEPVRKSGPESWLVRPRLSE